MSQPSDCWKQFSTEQLEVQYSPSMWQQRVEKGDVVLQHIRFSTEASSRAKENIPCQLDIPYGSSDRTRIDIFGADLLPKNSPILFYVHGGYWQLLGREIVSCFVETFVNAGIIVAVVGYDLAPNVKLDEIVNQIKLALVFMLNFADEQKSSGLFMCGWSAGAQLIAMSAGLCGNILPVEKLKYVKGFIFISGIFDLRPLEHTKVNHALLLSEADLIRNSPLYHVEELSKNYKNAQCLVAVGQYDPPEFHRQSQQYHEFLLRCGISSKLIVTENEDHFLIIENLCHSQTPLSQAMLRMMTAQLGTQCYG